MRMKEADICSALKVRGYPAFVSYVNGEMAESMLEQVKPNY